MARIRTIKPEFTTSETLVECSTSARLLFASMWCYCDDYGNYPAKLRLLKRDCFPYDDFTVEEMAGFVNELLSCGVLEEYVGTDDKNYWHVTSWDEHQKIDRKSKVRYPEPKFVEGSTSAQRVISESSMLDLDLDHGSGPNKNPPNPPSRSRGGKGRDDDSLESELARVPESIRPTVDLWLAYKAERRQAYKPLGLQQWVTRLLSRLETLGEAEVGTRFEVAMAKGWSDWDYEIKPPANGSLKPPPRSPVDDHPFAPPARWEDLPPHLQREYPHKDPALQKKEVWDALPEETKKEYMRVSRTLRRLWGNTHEIFNS